MNDSFDRSPGQTKQEKDETQILRGTSKVEKSEKDKPEKALEPEEGKIEEILDDNENLNLRVHPDGTKEFFNDDRMIYTVELPNGTFIEIGSIIQYKGVSYVVKEFPNEKNKNRYVLEDPAGNIWKSEKLIEILKSKEAVLAEATNGEREKLKKELADLQERAKKAREGLARVKGEIMYAKLDTEEVDTTQTNTSQAMKDIERIIKEAEEGTLKIDLKSVLQNAGTFVQDLENYVNDKNHWLEEYWRQENSRRREGKFTQKGSRGEMTKLELGETLKKMKAELRALRLDFENTKMGRLFNLFNIKRRKLKQKIADLEKAIKVAEETLTGYKE